MTNVYSSHTSDIDITLTQGSAFALSLYWVNDNGTPISLVNREVVWTVDIDDEGAVVKYPTSSDPTNGKIDLVLTEYEVEQIGIRADDNFGTHKLVARNAITGAYYRLALGSVEYRGTIGGTPDDPPEVGGGEVLDSVFNVLDFGAVGDGVADDTLAIQAAINEALGGPPEEAPSTQRIASGTVYIPPGNYKITGTLKIYSCHGMKFLGAGVNQTRLMPWGTIDVFIDINGSYLGTFGDFVIHGNGTYLNATVQTVFQMDWDPAVASRSTHNNTVQNIYIRELKCVTGFKFSKTATYQMDSLTVKRCTSYGGWTPGENTYWQTGFEYGNGTHANIYNHWISGGGAAFFKEAYRFRATNGPISVRDIDLAGNGTDLRVTGSCRLVFDTINSENSQIFYSEDGFAGFHTNVEFNNVRFANNGDYIDVPDNGRVIRFGYGGSKILRNVQFEYTGGTDGLKFHLINSYDLLTMITTIGLQTPETLTDLFEIDGSFAGTTPVSVVHMNYAQFDIDTATIISYHNFVNEEYIS